MEFPVRTIDDSAGLVRLGAIANLRDHAGVVGNPAIYDSAIEFRRDAPEGADRLALINEILARGYGDCEDLVAARLAELWKEGESSADVRARLIPPHSTVSGHEEIHVDIARADGTHEDPAITLHPDGAGLFAALVPTGEEYALAIRTPDAGERVVTGADPFTLIARIPRMASPIIEEGSLGHSILSRVARGQSPEGALAASIVEWLGRSGERPKSDKRRDDTHGVARALVRAQGPAQSGVIIHDHRTGSLPEATRLLQSSILPAFARAVTRANIEPERLVTGLSRREKFRLIHSLGLELS